MLDYILDMLAGFGGKAADLVLKYWWLLILAGIGLIWYSSGGLK